MWPIKNPTGDEAIEEKKEEFKRTLTASANYLCTWIGSKVKIEKNNLQGLYESKERCQSGN